MPKRRIPFLVLAIICAVLATRAPAWADTLRVPEDHDTIQDAIDAAADGDTVEVGPGLYEEHVDYLGKAILVVATAGARETEIDPPLPRPGVLIESVEAGVAELRGFFVSGGTGAVECRDAEVVLRDLEIASLQAPVIATDTTLTIDTCVMRDSNTGISVRCGETRLVDCWILDGGLSWFLSSGTCEGPLSMENCVVVGNTSALGAITCEAESVLENCWFEGNHGIALGGAISVEGRITLTDCHFADNTGKRGGALFLAEDATVSWCSFVDGAASVRGGAVEVLARDDELVTFDHCTFAGNSSEGGGALAFGTGAHGTVADGTVDLVNCIVWGNGDDAIAQVDKAALIRASYSVMEGGWDGEGILDEDPLFLDPEAGDYRLSEDSPAIDAGHPFSLEDPDDSVTDAGAFIYGYNRFRRGDSNADGRVSAINDAIFLLAWGFQEGPVPTCDASADVDGDRELDALADALALLGWAYLEGPPPPNPGPARCGRDAGALECVENALCQ